MINSSIACIFESLESIFLEIRNSLRDDFPTEFLRVGLAYSGGLDSSVLLNIATKYANKTRLKLLAFHIDHSINSKSEQWSRHCSKVCKKSDVEFYTHNVLLNQGRKTCLEEDARISRYAALGKLCIQHQVGILLTAHHIDDQAETILLQLLRGSGVAGLSGIGRWNKAPALLKNNKIVVARPLLNISRAELENYAVSQRLDYVEDESNYDTHHARNALRHHLMPVLARDFPGFQKRFARSAVHMQNAQFLLTDLAKKDMLLCADGDCLNLQHLRQLSEERIDNLLRHWIRLYQLRMPSKALTAEIRKQLLGAKIDSQICVSHIGYHIRSYRNHLFLIKRNKPDYSDIVSQEFHWCGEKIVNFPKFRGALHFDQKEQGISAKWLRTKELKIQLRSGGERLKLEFNRPTRDIKYYYQSFGIPPWERDYLPVVTIAGEIIFAAGVGMNYPKLGSGTGIYISLSWHIN